MVGRGEQADLAAQAGGICREGFAVELDGPGRGHGQAGEEFQQRRLAGAVGAEQGDELAGHEFEIEGPQRPQVAVGFGELVNG